MKKVLPILLLLLLLAACGQEKQSASQKRLVYGLTLLPSGFDPHINASSELGIPLLSVYDTLVYRHPQTQAFEQGLAESWEILDAGTRYRFKLKQNVVFHDGQAFNASAVAVNFDRIMNPENGSQKARFMLGPSYEGYAIVDDYTFEIRLSAPYQPLLDSLSQVYFGIASPLALANHADGTYQWHQVGTGPYKMVEAVAGDRIVLARNPDYRWGPPFYTVDNPNPIEEIEFRFYVDPATRDDALQSGEVGLVGELLPHDVELLLGNSDLRIYPTAVAGQPLQFIFNTGRVSDVNLRRALIHSVDRRAILDTVFAGQSPPANAPLSSNTEGANPDTEDLYPYDLGRAEELFRLAAVADTDGDNLLDRNGTPLELTLLAPPWNQIPEVAQVLAAQWRSQGVTVKIEQVPTYPMLLEKLDEGDYDLVALYDFGLDASVLNSYFLSNGQNNVAGYSNAELDSFLTQALAEPDPITRANLYIAAQEIIMREALIVPIREHVNLNGASLNLEGVIYDSHGWWPLLNNFQWKAD